jgi:hypothetical protein
MSRKATTWKEQVKARIDIKFCFSVAEVVNEFV